MLRTICALALLAPAAAFACPGSETAGANTKPTMASAAADPTHCAKDGSLVGSCCSYSTNLMAQRIHADGSDTTLASARLERTDDMLTSKVAAPWKAGEYRVIANAVMEGMDTSASLSLTGKTLEVDGVKYFLVTGASKSST